MTFEGPRVWYSCAGWFKKAKTKPDQPKLTTFSEDLLLQEYSFHSACRSFSNSGSSCSPNSRDCCPGFPSLDLQLVTSVITFFWDEDIVAKIRAAKLRSGLFHKMLFFYFFMRLPNTAVWPLWTPSKDVTRKEMMFNAISCALEPLQ